MTVSRVSPYSVGDEVYRVEGLVEGVIIDRLNRFTVEASIGGLRVYTHLTNTGRLKDIIIRGRRGLFIGISGRKLRYRLVAVEDNGLYAVVDTLTQNRVFRELVDRGYIPWLRGCRVESINPRFEGEVFDFLLSPGPIYVETKSAVLRFGACAAYPDCPTLRGRRHISKLIEMFKRGIKVYLVFIAALPNVKCFTPYVEGDPEIYRLVSEAIDVGVDVKAISIYMDSEGTIYLSDPDLRVEL